MDTFRIASLTESDFDAILMMAGAKRIDLPGQATEGLKSADYLLGNAIIELKLVTEEGLYKAERQKKLAALFGPSQPDRAIVVLSPSLQNSPHMLLRN